MAECNKAFNFCRICTNFSFSNKMNLTRVKENHLFVNKKRQDRMLAKKLILMFDGTLTKYFKQCDLLEKTPRPVPP